jgi:hypothetical protein
MTKHLLFILLFLCCGPCIAQSSFRKLSCPEKCWVLFHPRKALKARRITAHVMSVVDSIKKSNTIGSDGNGGQLDAFRHAYWMASLTIEIGAKQAGKLGKAHEKGNYRQFKKHRLEDAQLPDSVSCEMDLRNNAEGIESVAHRHFNFAEKELQELILKKLKDGELAVISKDNEGRFLACDGSLIDMNKWAGKWVIPKCLIPSAQH